MFTTENPAYMNYTSTDYEGLTRDLLQPILTIIPRLVETEHMAKPDNGSVQYHGISRDTGYCSGLTCDLSTAAVSGRIKNWESPTIMRCAPVIEGVIQTLGLTGRGTETFQRVFSETMIYPVLDSELYQQAPMEVWSEEGNRTKTPDSNNSRDSGRSSGSPMKVRLPKPGTARWLTSAPEPLRRPGTPSPPTTEDGAGAARNIMDATIDDLPQTITVKAEPMEEMEQEKFLVTLNETMDPLAASTSGTGATSQTRNVDEPAQDKPRCRGRGVSIMGRRSAPWRGRGKGRGGL